MTADDVAVLRVGAGTVISMYSYQLLKRYK